MKFGIPAAPNIPIMFQSSASMFHRNTSISSFRTLLSTLCPYPTSNFTFAMQPTAAAASACVFVAIIAGYTTVGSSQTRRIVKRHVDKALLWIEAEYSGHCWDFYRQPLTKWLHLDLWNVKSSSAVHEKQDQQKFGQQEIEFNTEIEITEIEVQSSLRLPAIPQEVRKTVGKEIQHHHPEPCYDHNNSNNDRPAPTSRPLPNPLPPPPASLASPTTHTPSPTFTRASSPSLTEELLDEFNRPILPPSLFASWPSGPPIYILRAQLRRNHLERERTRAVEACRLELNGVLERFREALKRLEEEGKAEHEEGRAYQTLSEKTKSTLASIRAKVSKLQPDLLLSPSSTLTTSTTLAHATSHSNNLLVLSATRFFCRLQDASPTLQEIEVGVRLWHGWDWDLDTEWALETYGLVAVAPTNTNDTTELQDRRRPRVSLPHLQTLSITSFDVPLLPVFGVLDAPGLKVLNVNAVKRDWVVSAGGSVSGGRGSGSRSRPESPNSSSSSRSDTSPSPTRRRSPTVGATTTTTNTTTTTIDANISRDARRYEKQQARRKRANREVAERCFEGEPWSSFLLTPPLPPTGSNLMCGESRGDKLVSLPGLGLMGLEVLDVKVDGVYGILPKRIESALESLCLGQGEVVF